MHTYEDEWNPDRAWRFKLVAGHAGLDFVNTADWHASAEPEEHLSSYAALVDWCRQAGLIEEGSASQLIERGQRRPEQASAVLAEAIELREAAFRVLSSRSDDLPADLAVVNRTVHRRAAACRIVACGERRVWEPVYADDLGAVVGPVALQLSAVMTNASPGRVKECEAPGCGWLFIDTSRTGRRRWCSMAECGNRNKVRRHYERHRLAAPAEGSRATARSDHAARPPVRGTGEPRSGPAPSRQAKLSIG